MGRKVDLIIPQVLQARHWRGFNQAIETGHMKLLGRAQDPAVHKTGAILPFRASLVLGRADDGEVDRAVATIIGQGPAWLGIAWRVVLAPLGLGQLVRRRESSE